MRGIDTAETNFFAEDELNGDTANGTNGMISEIRLLLQMGMRIIMISIMTRTKLMMGIILHMPWGMRSSRHDQAEKGNLNQTTDGVSTALDERAYAAGKHSVAALEREVGYKGIERDTDKTVSYVRTENDQALIHNGTKKADGVEDVQPLSIYTPGTDLFGSGQSYDKELVEDMANRKGKVPLIIAWGDKKGNSRVSGEELANHINDMNLKADQEPVVINYWGGNNEVVDRKQAGKEMADLVENYEFRKDETLDVAGHSHGGNVNNEFTQAYEGDKKLDTMVLLGTPQRADHQLDWSDTDKNTHIVNLYDTGDRIQIIGGGEPIGPSGRKLNGAKNISIYQTKLTKVEENSREYYINQHLGPIKSHTNLDSADVWNKYVKSELEKPKSLKHQD